jgi:phosphoenolpyruvate carboxylase
LFIMDTTQNSGTQNFKDNVALKFHLYNSLFSALPFHRIEKTGNLLPILYTSCKEGFKSKLTPTQIIDQFFVTNTTINNEKDTIDLLFRLLQYIERQVVLFDAIEDAAFTTVNNMEGKGTLKQLVNNLNLATDLPSIEKILETFSLQLVLTAHPTQFYPGTVLGIINDLAKAIQQNDAAQINMYLLQLGKTPFLKKQKPTPYDEAISLIWYLENIFYKSIGRTTDFLHAQFPFVNNKKNAIVQLGFWPGGDRDGNPFVTADITLKVANALRSSIIKCYYKDVKNIKRRLTFKNVDTIITALETQLHNAIYAPHLSNNFSQHTMMDLLLKIKEIIIHEYNGLFLQLVVSLINKLHIFGFHFASLDIRQESSVHQFIFETIYGEEYTAISDTEKINFLLNCSPLQHNTTNDSLVNDTLTNITNIKLIQQQNGVLGCNRYIISQCNSALHVLQVYALFKQCGYTNEQINTDIVPLFETIDDLEKAAAIMQELYNNITYKNHLTKQNNRQVIMLGFSDGTKDGGYLMANYSIYKAKQNLTAISKQYNIDVVFFDGRGGPPARGGGKTHQFYASMGNTISNKEIQLTIQGQTISSNFGTTDSSQYNIEQLLHAGISNNLHNNNNNSLSNAENDLFELLAQKSYEAYCDLKNNPSFIDYLTNVSPVKYYNETNIASRPSKRNVSNAFAFKDLRAIPYVGSWSQLKQNVTGFYGVGTAIEAIKKLGKFEEAKKLYTNSLFFRTLLNNSEMALKKCYFPLTEYLSNNARYSEIWYMIYKEYELTKNNILQLSGKTELMSDFPVDSLSIVMREKIVLPLLTIQQYAILKIRKMEEDFIDSPLKEVYKKLIIRCSFGIINAGRNSA